MHLSTAIAEIAERNQRLQAATLKGRLTEQDTLSLQEGYVYLYKDGAVPVLGLGHSGSALPFNTDEYDGIPFIITKLQEDRDGDIVVPLGCRIESYSLNPVWFFGHQQWEIPIGTSRRPDGRIMVFAEEQQVKSWWYADRQDPDADFIYGKVKRGVLNATSMAFVPIRAYRREREEHRGYYSDDKARLHNQATTPPGWVFEEYDLTEISIVGVPSNAGAIRDSLDKEASYLSPRLQKGLGAYAAQAQGCWNGWCPPGFRRENEVCVPSALQPGISGHAESERKRDPMTCSSKGSNQRSKEGYFGEEEDPGRPDRWVAQEATGWWILGKNGYRNGPYKTREEAMQRLNKSSSADTTKHRKAATQADMESSNEPPRPHENDTEDKADRSGVQNVLRLRRALIQDALEDILRRYRGREVDSGMILSAIKRVVQELPRYEGEPPEARQISQAEVNRDLADLESMGRITRLPHSAGEDSGQIPYRVNRSIGQKDTCKERCHKSLEESSGTSGGYTISEGDGMSDKQRLSEDIDSDLACKILKDGTIDGKPLTPAQRGMFGAACARSKKSHGGLREKCRRALHLLKGSVRKQKVTDKNGREIVEGATVIDNRGQMARVVEIHTGWVKVRYQDGHEESPRSNTLVVGKSMSSTRKKIRSSCAACGASGRRKTVDDSVNLQPAADDDKSKDEEMSKDLGGEGEEESAAPKPSAQVLAALYSHAKSESDYIDDELTKMDHPGVSEALMGYRDNHVAPRMEALKDLLGEHHTDQDMEKLCKALEGDGAAGGGEDTPGELGMVEEGNVPPDTAEEDSEDLGSKEEGEEEGEEEGGLKEELESELEPEKAEVYSPEWEEEEAEEEAHKDESMGEDPGQEEILERYRHPKSGKIMVRKVGTIRRKRGRVYLIRKQPTTEVPENPSQGQVLQTSGEGFNKGHALVIHKAADHMEALTEAPDIPRHHHAGLSHHSTALKDLVTEMGPGNVDPNSPVSSVPKASSEDYQLPEQVARRWEAFERKVFQHTGIKLS